LVEEVNDQIKNLSHVAGVIREIATPMDRAFIARVELISEIKRYFGTAQAMKLYGVDPKFSGRKALEEARANAIEFGIADLSLKTSPMDRVRRFEPPESARQKTDFLRPPSPMLEHRRSRSEEPLRPTAGDQYEERERDVFVGRRRDQGERSRSRSRKRSRVNEKCRN
jgi:hypothetical protein